MLKENLTHTSSLVVSQELSAKEMGSGDMPVLATPALVALMENAAMLSVAEHLPQGSTTVGGFIEVKHLKASAIGASVSATATLEKIDGIKLYFKIVATEGNKTIGEASHTRFIVDREKFLSKL